MFMTNHTRFRVPRKQYTDGTWSALERQGHLWECALCLRIVQDTPTTYPKHSFQLQIVLEIELRDHVQFFFGGAKRSNPVLIFWFWLGVKLLVFFSVFIFFSPSRRKMCRIILPPGRIILPPA